MNKLKSNKMNKKGLSEIISYVLLILIALSLSAAVFVWLKVYIPKNSVECPKDASLIIKDYSCDINTQKISIIFQNKGYYDIDGVYIKIANTTDGIASELPEPPSISSTPSEPGFFYFGFHGLLPGKSDNQTFEYTAFTQVTKVQIQPFVLRDDKIIICTRDTKSQEITNCNYPSSP